ncbi:MAG: nucleotidyltransferase domain-containing protein [Planctomycetota bacterium]|jgi:predicted nucleotidyltransferase
MKEKILQALASIEEKSDVKILYACESGSRAWGFESTDSDYDVRFIYLHRPNWYLSINIESKRDVIEIPIDGVLDINGWDLRKALKLFRKSNPPLYEWLGSPIIYLEKYSVAKKMRQLAPSCYSPIACMYHYYKMAKGNNREFLKGPNVKRKKYFYVLRPILAVIWIERELGVVPTEFQVLVDTIVESSELKKGINDLLEAKRIGKELDYGPRIEVISNFIDAELERMENEQFEKRTGKCPVEKLNELFRNVLEEVYS